MDDHFDEHPKVLAILDEDDLVAAAFAISMWTLTFTWAHRNTRKRGRTPGLLPASLPRRFFGREGRAGIDLLVKYGMWDPHESGGWMIHNFEDYLPTDETREVRSEAGKRGAAKRWANHKRASDSESEEDGNLPSQDGNEPSPCHDADSKTMASDGSRAPARWAISKEIAPTPRPKPGPEEPLRSTDAEPQSDNGLFDAPPPKPETANQRVNRVTKIYTDVVKLSTFGAVQQIVKEALKCDDYTEEQVIVGIEILRDNRSTVTKNTLRHAIEGTAPWPQNRARYPPNGTDSNEVAVRNNGHRSPADRKMADAIDLARQFAERDGT
jgi:hypothetical protein